MNTVERRRSPVYRQVEAYEESWKRNHDAVQECWAWEDTIAVGLSTCSLVERADRAWRDRVFRGAEALSDDANTFYRTLYEVWLRVTEAILEEASRLEGDFGSVEGAGELGQAAERVRQRLASWQPPRLSLAVGLRDQTLTPEAAGELDRIL